MSDEGVWIHQLRSVAVKLYGSKNQVYACSNTSHNTSYNTSHNTSQKYQSVLLSSCVDALAAIAFGSPPRAAVIDVTSPLAAVIDVGPYSSQCLDEPNLSPLE